MSERIDTRKPPHVVLGDGVDPDRPVYCETHQAKYRNFASFRTHCSKFHRGEYILINVHQTDSDDEGGYDEEGEKQKSAMEQTISTTTTTGTITSFELPHPLSKTGEPARVLVAPQSVPSQPKPSSPLLKTDEPARVLATPQLVPSPPKPASPSVNSALEPVQPSTQEQTTSSSAVVNQEPSSAPLQSPTAGFSTSVEKVSVATEAIAVTTLAKLGNIPRSSNILHNPAPDLIRTTSMLPAVTLTSFTSSSVIGNVDPSRKTEKRKHSSTSNGHGEASGHRQKKPRESHSNSRPRVKFVQGTKSTDGKTSDLERPPETLLGIDLETNTDRPTATSSTTQAESEPAGQISEEMHLEILVGAFRRVVRNSSQKVTVLNDAKGLSEDELWNRIDTARVLDEKLADSLEEALYVCNKMHSVAKQARNLYGSLISRNRANIGTLVIEQLRKSKNDS